jgi:competence protein ComEA
MESGDFFSFVPPVIRQHVVPLSIGTVGVVLILVGFLPMIFREQKHNELVFDQGAEHGASVAAASTVVSEAKIQVDVAGAVIRPGVYSLSPESRVKEAIAIAGGFSDKANSEWIAKNLNLAGKLSDAMKIYVPFEGESVESGLTSSTSTTGNLGLININSASESQLDSLAGVGLVTAQKIISGRPYSAIDDLLTRKIVGQSVFGKIKGQVTVN